MAAAAAAFRHSSDPPRRTPIVFIIAVVAAVIAGLAGYWLGRTRATAPAEPGVAALTDVGKRELEPRGGDAAASAADELARTRAELARYRALVIDIENNAPPPILQGAGEPDDLKLIVGIGPVLERMLRALGVTSFRQIARWGPREVAEFDSRLPEFPGRIERDQWVTQARALHEAKYGEDPRARA
jgi:NADH-quinone oxidoreductase subunit E